MPTPKGFDDLVKIAMKERPGKSKTVGELWERFLRIVFMGGKRSEAEVSFLISLLKSKKLLELDFVKATDGEDWQEMVQQLIDERAARIKDDDILTMLKEFRKDAFRITASIKGSARWFKKNEITPQKLEEMLSTKEKTWQFVEDLATNEDVSNIKYTKVIIWLHSIGYGQDFVPPTYQTKKFVNDEFGYYQFYEDDKYFMKKAEEFADSVRKRIKAATPRDVASAIFFYVTLKNMFPQRSREKRAFNCTHIVKYLKKKKLTLAGLSEMLSDFEKKQGFIEDFSEFMHKEL